MWKFGYWSIKFGSSSNIYARKIRFDPDLYSVFRNYNYQILLCDPKGPFKDQTVCKVEPVRQIDLIKTHNYHYMALWSYLLIKLGEGGSGSGGV